MPPRLRLSMWSGPRNVSTALMYSFRQRSDTSVIDEPLYGHYLSATGADHPAAHEVMEQMERDGSAVVCAMVEGSSPRPVLFFKNMAHHLRGLDDDLTRQLFSGALTHALLIRDPHEMLPSLARVLNRPTLADTGLVEQREILQRELSEGRQPVVIDSRELLRDPVVTLKAVCEAVGLEFEAEMLSWPSGPKPEDGVWAQHWYSSVHRTTGFSAYRSPGSEFPAELKGLLSECLPYYRFLAEYSLDPLPG